MLGAIFGLIGLGSGIKQSIKNSVNDDCAKNRATENGKLYYTDHNFIIRSCISGKPVKIIQNKYGTADYYDPITNEILTRGSEFDERVKEAKEKAKRMRESYYFTFKTGDRTLETDLPLENIGGTYLKTPKYKLLFHREADRFNKEDMIKDNRYNLYKIYERCYYDGISTEGILDEAKKYGIIIFESDVKYLENKISADDCKFTDVMDEVKYTENKEIEEKYRITEWRRI